MPAGMYQEEVYELLGPELALLWPKTGWSGVFLVQLAPVASLPAQGKMRGLWLCCLHPPMCPHQRAQAVALEPGPEQSQETAGDGSSLRHPLTQAFFPDVTRAAERLQAGERAKPPSGKRFVTAETDPRTGRRHAGNARLKASQGTAAG